MSHYGFIMAFMLVALLLFSSYSKDRLRQPEDVNVIVRQSLMLCIACDCTIHVV